MHHNFFILAQYKVILHFLEGARGVGGAWCCQKEIFLQNILVRHKKGEKYLDKTSTG
jgi:hypothetical protein